MKTFPTLCLYYFHASSSESLIILVSFWQFAVFDFFFLFFLLLANPLKCWWFHKSSHHAVGFFVWCILNCLKPCSFGTIVFHSKCQPSAGKANTRSESSFTFVNVAKIPAKDFKHTGLKRQWRWIFNLNMLPGQIIDQIIIVHHCSAQRCLQCSYWVAVSSFEKNKNMIFKSNSDSLHGANWFLSITATWLKERNWFSKQKEKMKIFSKDLKTWWRNWTCFNCSYNFVGQGPIEFFKFVSVNYL